MVEKQPPPPGLISEGRHLRGRNSNNLLGSAHACTRGYRERLDGSELT